MFGCCSAALRRSFLCAFERELKPVDALAGCHVRPLFLLGTTVTLESHKIAAGDEFQCHRAITAGFSLHVVHDGPIRPGCLEADPFQWPPGAIGNTKKHGFVEHLLGRVDFRRDHDHFLSCRSFGGRELDVPEYYRILRGAVAARRNPVKAGWKAGERIPALRVARRLVHEAFGMIG